MIALHIERSHEQGALLAGPPAEVDAIAAAAGLTSRDACDDRIRVVELRDAPGVRAETVLRAAVALAGHPPDAERFATLAVACADGEPLGATRFRLDPHPADTCRACL